MNANGSGQTRLTVNPGFDNRDPAWSPDGQRIAFTSARDGNSEIYVMKADGSAQTRLTTDPARDFSAAWSPDGTRIAFASARTGAHDVYVMNADGSGQTRLTTDPASDFNPAWSPDGAKIAYESTTTFGDGGGEVLLMNADGSGRTNLTNNPEERPAARLADDPRRLCRRQGRPGGGEGVLHGDGGGVGRVHDRPTGVGGRLRDPAAPGRQAGGRHARTGRRRGRRGRRRGLRRVQGSAPGVPAAGDAADGAISLGQAGTLSKLLLDLPLKGSVTVAWADGGTSSSFDREIDVESLTQAVGKLVSLRPGESVNRAGGKLSAKLVNGQGAVLNSLEVKIDELNVVPSKLKVMGTLGLRNLLLRLETKMGVRQVRAGRGIGTKSAAAAAEIHRDAAGRARLGVACGP
jgi:hypothetical protein